MKEKVSFILKEIYLSLQDRDRSALSILEGESGYCLFEQLYTEHTCNTSPSKFQYNLQLLAENSIGVTYPTFANGKPGINWLFTYLNKKKILSKADWKVLCDDDSKMPATALSFLEKGHYDFLHGAIGIVYHLLYSRGNTGKYKKFYTDFFDRLEESGAYHEGKFFIPDFDRGTGKVRPDKINFGLAHGIPSILKLCTQCYKQNICSVQAKEIATRIIDFLRFFENNDKTESYFPSYIILNTPDSVYSRLGWCYGDLGIGIILYQTAIAFNDNGLKEYASAILSHTTKRKELKQTYVYDADVCHGTAGIAHIYNRMWHYTNNFVFKEACDYWMQKTVDMASYTDGLGGYKSYLPYRKSYEISYSLLDGACGIGLAMISYLTGDFSWDYCLMLND
jgi:lantibiotic modifying enzyme